MLGGSDQKAMMKMTKASKLSTNDKTKKVAKIIGKLDPKAATKRAQAAAREAKTGTPYGNSPSEKPTRPMPPKPSAGGGAPRQAGLGSAIKGLGAVAGRAMPPMKKGGKVAAKKAKAK